MYARIRDIGEAAGGAGAVRRAAHPVAVAAHTAAAATRIGIRVAGTPAR
jgi:hypothetical protein